MARRLLATPRLQSSDAELRETIDTIASGFFSSGDQELFQPLVESLFTWDDYILLADYRSYVDCQDRVSKTYRDMQQWTHMSIPNMCRIGRFSSDRAIRQYCREVWHVDSINTERT